MSSLSVGAPAGVPVVPAGRDGLDADGHGNLRALLDNAANFVLYRVAVDPQAPSGRRVVFVARSIRDIVGVREPERFESWLERAHPDDLLRIRESLRSAAERPRAVNELVRVYHPDKQAWVWLQVISTPELDERGVATHFNGIILDVSAQKQAEAELEQRIAFENMVTRISKNFINLAPAHVDSGIYQTLEAIGELAAVDRSYLFQFSEDRTTLSMTHEWCAPGVEPQKSRTQNLPMQLFSWSLQPILRLEVLHIPSVSVLPAAAGPDRAEFELEGVKSLVVVPLVYRGSAIGFLGFDSLREERTWSDESITLLKMVSDILVSALERRHVAAAADSAVAVERMRLARDLHDSVTQTLFSASLIAEVLPRLWERKPDEARRRLEELRQLTRGALAEMRTLLLELRPSALTEVPLAELLRHLTEAATGRLRVPVTLEVLGECDLPPDVRVALYRIAQEALNNIVKHAAAGRASVSLRCGHGGVELVIGDDGRGFDARAISADHLGLNIMRERAEAIRAGLTIDSKAGAGTRVLVVWRRPSVEGGIDGRSAEYSRADR